jgi:UDP-N-acetylmuramate dehydrogenase
MSLKIHQQYSLQAFNTLGLPGVAEYFCAVSTQKELQQALIFGRENRLNIELLGGGSNTVVNGDMQGLVIHPQFKGIECLQDKDNDVILRVAAGENWHQFVKYCLENDLYGIENLALIPGLVGAAPIQNIGAYGIELSEVLESVTLTHIDTGETEMLDTERCQLGYRDSIFKHDLRGQVVITQVDIRLSRVPVINLSYPALAAELPNGELTPMDVFNTVCQLRQSKLPDPELIPNAGSFFKNPVLSAEESQALLDSYSEIPCYPQDSGNCKFPAAWFIDQAGWKGRRKGNVAVHEKQALVLVNLGGATGEELLAFAAEIAADVRQRFGVDLEMEPVILGRS